MQITILRLNRLLGSTLGVLIVEGTHFQCATLEPALPIDNGGERVSKGPIPPGRYEVKWRWSNHFNRQMPYVENVPNFTGIMIHPGNTAKDTKGCILVGRTPANDTTSTEGRITQSRATFSKLEAILQSATDPIWIVVK